MELTTVFQERIKHFSKVTSRDDPNSVLESDIFQLTGTKIKFHLHFEPTTRGENYSKEYCAFFLFLDESTENNMPIKIEYQIWIETSNGEKIIKSRVSEGIFYEIGEAWGSYVFIQYDKLCENVKDDIIFICCEIRQIPSSDCELKSCQNQVLQKGNNIAGNSTSQIGKGYVSTLKSVFESNLNVSEEKMIILTKKDTLKNNPNVSNPDYPVLEKIYEQTSNNELAKKQSPKSSSVESNTQFTRSKKVQPNDPFQKFKWPIDDFSKKAIYGDPSLTLESKEFKLFINGTRFQLKFYPTSNTGNGYSALFLVVKYMTDESVIRLESSFWVENNFGELIVPKSEVVCELFTKNQCAWGYRAFVHQRDLYFSKRIKDDFVFICCEVRRVSLRIHDQLESKFYANIYIIQVGEEKFNVSKDAFMANIDVFETMFSVDMQKRKITVVNINEFDAQIMKIFVDFLHENIIDKLEDVAEDLFAIACKYRAKDLESKCLEFMITSFTVDNAIRRLQMAINCDNNELSILAFEYCSNEGNFRQIIKTEEWNNFARENKETANLIIDKAFS